MGLASYCRVFTACLWLALLIVPPSAWATNGTAFLVLSGARPSKHLCNLIPNFEKTMDSFSSWDRVVFADGGPSDPSPNAPVCDAAGNALFDAQMRPRYERRMPQGTRIAGAAKWELVSNEVIKRVPRMKPDEPVLLYFAGHGGTSGGVHYAMWEESINPSHIRTLLSRIPKTRKVVLVFDQCKAANMFEGLWDDSGQIRPNTCAFAPAGVDEISNVGDYFMSSAHTLVEKHRDPNGPSSYDPLTFMDVLKYSASKGTERSTPISSSAYFLEKYLASRADSKTDSKICAECGNRTQTLSPSSYPALVAQIHLLRQQFKEETKKAGFPESATISQLQAKADQAKRKWDALNKEPGRLKALSERAKTEFAKTKVGRKKYDRYSQLRKQIETLEASLRKRADPAEQNRLQKLRADYSVLSAEIDQARKSAVDEDADFRTFLAKRKKDFPARIPELIRKAEVDAWNASAAYPLIRKPLQAAKQLAALEAILKKNDHAALLAYLDLLACESTVVEKPLPSYRRYFR